MFVDIFGREKALLMIVDKFNFYWVYFENLYSFKTHEIFSNITLNPEKWNIKLNKKIREKALFIDPNWTTNTSWKKIVIDWKDLWLADLWNILYAYNWKKAWYWINSLIIWGFIATSWAYDQWYKNEWPLNNEMEDWKFYEIWVKLAKETKTWEFTKDDLLNAYFSIFPEGQ